METKNLHHKELIRAYGQNIVRAIDKLRAEQKNLTREIIQAEAEQIVYAMLFVAAAEQRSRVKPTKEKLEQVWQHFFELSDFTIEVKAPVPILKDVKRYLRPDKVPVIKKRLGKRKGLAYLGELVVKSLENISREPEEKQVTLLARALPLFHYIYKERNQTEISYDVLLEEIFKEFPFKISPEEVLELAAPPSDTSVTVVSTKKRSRNNGKKRKKWRKNY